jgi:thiamine biosynthesis lipoprotein
MQQQNTREKKSKAPIALIAALAVLGVVASVMTSGQKRQPRALIKVQPRGIMGTSCQLVAIADKNPTAQSAIRAAERSLRLLEAKMSTWIETSELSRFNRSAVGKTALSKDTLRVFRAAKAMHTHSHGAFDVTCRPLIELWRQAAKAKTLPSATAIAAARARSNWSQITLHTDGAQKSAATARVDLGGIAKGFAIDRALSAMKARGAKGGLVDIGGDMRVFGDPPSGKHWTIHVRSPFKRGQTIATLALKKGAVCTSGNYARYVEIGGKRFSHILDPKSGRPVDRVPSVTVIADDAMTADGWATALSVLGKGGLKRLPAGIDAMLIDGQTKRATATAGFVAKLTIKPKLPISIMGNKTLDHGARSKP